MAAWIKTLVLETVIEAVSSTHMNPSSFYGSIAQILRSKEKEIPTKIREYVEGQVKHGQSIGYAQISGSLQGVQSELEASREMATTVSRFTRTFNETAASALEGIISAHIKQGLTIKETTEGIREWAGKNGDLDRQVKWRASTVARTESARAIVNGQVAAWKDSGVVTHMRWLIAPQPCEFCLAVYRKFRQVKLGVNFLNTGQTLTGTRGGKLAIDYSNIQGPPLHPNCLCDVEPVVQGQERLRPNPSRSRDSRIG